MTRRSRVAMGALIVVATAAVGLSLRSNGKAADADLTRFLPPSTTAPDNSAFGNCRDCHLNLDPQDRTEVDSLIFTHLTHDERGGVVGCRSCHTRPPHQDGGTRRPSMSTCLRCHRDTPAASMPCSACHPLSTLPAPLSHSDSDWSNRHGVGGVNAELCDQCHSEQQFCTACHGLEMPHPAEWPEAPHAVAYFDLEEATCRKCHQWPGPPADQCGSCHHLQTDSWTDSHRIVVIEQGGATCFACHAPATCVRCHVDGVLDLTADRGNVRSTTETSG